MRHVSLVGSLSLVAAWGLRPRLPLLRHARAFVVGPRWSGAASAASGSAGPRARNRATVRGAATAARQDPYSVLQIPAGTRDESEVRAAFRKLAKIYHPDVPGTGDPERFQAVQEAAQRLLEDNGGGVFAQGASLESIFSWAPTGPVSRTASSTRVPSSAAKPLEQSDFAWSRGMRVDVPACAARRRTDLRKVGKLKMITHDATPETLARVQGVLSKYLGYPAAALHPGLPLEQIGFVLEQNCVGFQHVADIAMALEEEFGIQILTILVGTWMKLDIPESAMSVQGLADYIESKMAA